MSEETGQIYPETTFPWSDHFFTSVGPFSIPKYPVPLPPAAAQVLDENFWELAGCEHEPIEIKEKP